MVRRVIIAVLTIPLFLAIALPDCCQAQATVYSSQGLRWGVVNGDGFNYTLSSFGEPGRLPQMTDVAVIGNVTGLPSIPDYFQALPTGRMKLHLSNGTLFTVSLPVLPVGNWSTIRSHFENRDETGYFDCVINEDPSTFSVVLGLANWLVIDSNTHQYYPEMATNLTLDFSKTDGALYRYLEAVTNITSRHTKLLVEIVRLGYIPPLSIPVAVGSVVLLVEFAVAVIIVRRIISSRKAP